MNPLISVIIPIYKMEDYLSRCIESVIKQTYRNLDVILVNDGSPDSSGSICDEYALKDSRITVIHKTNGGVSSARNAGFKVAEGKYIAYVDPDDYIAPAMIEILCKNIEEHGCDIISCCPDIETVDGLKKNSFFKIGADNFMVVDKQRAIMQLLWSEYHGDNEKFMDIGVPWGKLYRKSLLTENGIVFHESLRRMQDNIFNLYAFQAADKIVYLDEALYIYNYTNISQEFNKYVADLDLLFSNVVNETYHFLKKHGWMDLSEIRQAFSAKACTLLVSILSSKIFHRKHELPLTSRMKMVNKLVSSEPFKSSLINVDLNHFKPQHKILIILLRNHRFFEAYLLFKASDAIKFISLPIKKLKVQSRIRLAFSR